MGFCSLPACRQLVTVALAVGIALVVDVPVVSRAFSQETPRVAPHDERPFRIVGYLPDYRADGLDLEAVSMLTDLILFSAEPTAELGLDLQRLTAMPWTTLRSLKTRQRIRMLLAIGGWERSRQFPVVAASDASRRQFATSVVQCCLRERLDGIDLDWEHPKSELEEKDYALLLVELQRQFLPHGLTLSVTMAAWQKIPKHGIAAVDWVQIMAYDHPQQHSTLEDAKRDVEQVVAQGALRSQITLGVPFYGRDISNAATTMTFRELMALSPRVAMTDEWNGIYYNGPKTIQAKTAYAIEHRLAGVMIWEIGQDAPGKGGLLPVIYQTVHAPR